MRFSYSSPLRDCSVPLSTGERMFLNYTSNHSYAVFYGREVTVNTKIILCKQSFTENTGPHVLEFPGLLDMLFL